ncbi:MAG: thioredoxin family protein [Chloroflexi bacterium]|nr:thioredoxin family protein [Chloroflexota bacterium]
MESSKVRTDVVEVQKFPQLAQQYSFRSVPMPVINNKTIFTGALNATGLLDRIKQTVDMEPRGEDGQPTDIQATRIPR